MDPYEARRRPKRRCARTNRVRVTLKGLDEQLLEMIRGEEDLERRKAGLGGSNHFKKTGLAQVDRYRGRVALLVLMVVEEKRRGRGRRGTG